MGVIRKTLSVTTLGLVGWKSKGEQLAETEAELAVARAELEETSALRSALEQRLGSVEKELEGAEHDAASGAKAARREERRRQRRARLDAAAREAEARAEKARRQAEAKAEEAKARFEKSTRKARKTAERAARDARGRLRR